ncbi:MAG: FAD-binding oxidoreductase [Mesorhizobium sp.]
MTTRAHQSFGRTFAPASAVIGADEGLRSLLERRSPATSMLPVGNTRSYGDSCLNSDGLIIDMASMNRILSFDASTGVMVAEAGVSLDDIIAFAAPHGYFPAVVPGTRYITLGGAIANDVHGKNHHRRGTFGRHVESLDLLRSDGEVSHCSPSHEAAMFGATVGGMGLTGIILRATIRLMKVSSLDVDETVTPFGSLDDYFDLADEADAANEYAVAWVDQLASGRGAGRGLLLTGNHAEGPSMEVGRARLGVPFQPPVNVLNRPFLTAFNFAYRTAKSARRQKRSSFSSFFFPLDGVSNWNRLYGPAGLHQHQSVVPVDAARIAIPAMFDAARAAGQGSFLTVLKKFGDVASPGLISFPRPGFTLTLDFPNRGRSTLDLLARLDAIAVDAGGAVNPYKDARMSPQTFDASFAHWRRLEAMRDPAFMSDFWRRTALRLEEIGMPLAAAAE